MPEVPLAAVVSLRNPFVVIFSLNTHVPFSDVLSHHAFSPSVAPSCAHSPLPPYGSFDR